MTTDFQVDIVFFTLSIIHMNGAIMTMFNFFSRDTLTKGIEHTHGRLSMAQITGT